MRKRKRIFATLLILLAITLCLFACAGKEEGASIPTTVTPTEDGIIFSHPNYTYFYYTVDGGEEKEADPDFVIPFSDTVGEHVVRVYALSTAQKQVAVKEFTYSTVALSLSDLSVSGKTVSWVAIAKDVYVKGEGDYAPTTENTYTASSDNVTVRVKAEGGFDQDRSVYYTGNPIIKEATVMPDVLAPLSSPTLKLSDKRVTWKKVSKATGYAVSYDGGNYVAVTENVADISDAVGEHTISVKALGDGSYYGESVPAVFRYETKVSSLKVTKSASDKATFLSETDVYWSGDGVDFLPVETKEFTASESCTLFFIAHGFDKENNKNYVAGSAVEMSFVAAAVRDLLFEDGSESGLSDRWTTEQYGESSWTASNASVAVGKKYDASPAVTLRAWNNNVAYRFSSTLALSAGYDHLSFDYLGDGISRVYVTLGDNESGYYIRRDLGVMPAHWTHVTLCVEEEGWLVNGAFPLKTLWDMRGSEEAAAFEIPKAIEDAFSLYEILPFLDRISFTLIGNDEIGKATTHSMDDLTFGFNPEAKDGVKQPLFGIGNSYIAREKVSDGLVNEWFLFLSEEGTFRLYSTSLENNFILNGTYLFDEEKETLQLSDPDVSFSLSLSYADNGRTIAVTASDGAPAAHLRALAFLLTADLLIDFDEGESGEPYLNEDWKVYTANDEAWRPLSTSQIYYDQKNSSGVIVLHTGKYLTNKFVYREEGNPLGLVNYFSFDLGNYAEGASSIGIKVIALDRYGVRHYLIGDESEFETFAVTDNLLKKERSLQEALYLTSIEIVTKNIGEEEVAFLYLDDLTAKYKADTTVFSGYAAPIITPGQYSLTFMHEDESATLEYSLDDGVTWTEGNSFDIPSVKGNYVLRVRGKIGADEVLTKPAIYAFAVREVSLSQISVSIEERGHTAFWQSNGIVSVKVGKKTDSGILEGTFIPVSDNSYFTNENVILTVKAEGYFDEENKVYYIGTQELSKKILVDVVLSAPVLMPTAEGIVWEEVEDADSYAVSVNNGDYVVRADRLITYASNEATYRVRVIAVTLDDNGEITAYSNYDEYCYDAKKVSLSKLKVNKSTISWTAEAYKVYCKVNNGDFEETAKSEYEAVKVGAHRVTIKAVAGFDIEHAVYYYSAKDLTENESVTVRNLPAPTLLLNDNKNGLTWAFVNQGSGENESDEVATVEDMNSAFPFLTYCISVNDGEWTEATSYAFPSEPGVYSVRVMTVGNGENYKDSVPSKAFIFEVKTLALSDIEITEQSEALCKASYSYEALHLYRKVGANDPSEEEIEDTVFNTNVTVILYLRAVGGYDEKNAIYYVGTEISKEKKVIVPIYLSAPELSLTKNGIEWNAVKNADSYGVSVNGGAWTRVTVTSFAYDTTATGDYSVAVKAVNNDSLQYPDSEASVIEYHVVRIALSKPWMEGSVAVWDYSGLLSLRVEEEGKDPIEYDPYDSDRYANEKGADVTIFVKVKTGYDGVDTIYVKDEENHTQIEEELPLQYKQLLTPAVRLNGAGNGLIWDEVSKASGYAYKELPAESTEEQIAAATWTNTGTCAYPFSETEGDYLVLIKAVGNGLTITDSLTKSWRYGVREVVLSEISVDEKGVATWTKTGITTLQTVSNENGSISIKEFPIVVTTFAPEATLTVNLRCAGGYSEEENIYYVGETITKNKQIVVPIRLEKPSVRLMQDGVSLGRVSHSDSWEIKVNDGEYSSFTSALYPYADAVGHYVLKIRAANTDEDQAKQYPVSEDVEISYDVYEISLSEITDQNGSAVFTAVGILSAKEEGGAFMGIAGSPYSPAATTTVTIRASVGVDPDHAVKYIGDKENLEKSKKIVVPIKLQAPILTEGAENLTIGTVDYANGYLVSRDGGAWIPATGTTLSYSSAAGAHAISVKAYAEDSAQYPESDAVTVEYTTKLLSLSDISLSGAKFSWSVVAHSVRISLNNGSYSAYTASTYTATEVGETKLSVRAYAGYLSSAHTYYYGNSASVTKSATVSISRLPAPTLSVSGNKIAWSAVQNATAYAVKTNSGNYANQSATSASFSSQEGAQTLYVKAIGNGSTLLDSAEATFTYNVKIVSLPALSVVGAKVSWNGVVALKTSISLNGGSYTQTNDTSFTVSAGGTVTVKVKAEGGWDASGRNYYYAASPIEKSATVTLATLKTPTLTANDKGISWTAVSNATGYMVKLDNGSFASQTNTSVSFSTTAGNHTLSVKAVGAATSGYSDSAVATYTYTTKQTALSFLSSTDTRVAWLLTGIKVQYSTNNGTSYSDTTLTGYTAKSSGTVKFRAVGGWDASSKTYYNGTTSAQSKTFTLPGLAIGDNFENGVGTWIKEYYSDSWKTADAASVSAATDAYGTGTAVKLHSFLNGMSYRFCYQFGDLPEKYYSLSFDIKLNDYTANGTTFRFQDSASGTYVDYKLDVLKLTAGVWYHVKVGFEDENLIINSGNKEYTAPKAKSLLGEKSFYEKIMALDKVYVNVRGDVDGGVDAYTFVDNFQFSTSKCTTATSTRITTKEMDFNDGSTTGWKQYAYQSTSYVSAGSVTIANASDKDRVLNLYTGGTTYKFTYNEGGSSLGSVNHFSIDLGGENNDNSVRYRIELITDSGSTIYAAGGEGSMVSMSSPKGISSLKTLNFNFTTTKIKSIIIYATSSNGHLYADNMILSKLS